MMFREYQDRALSTRQPPAVQASDRIIPLLGLAGEVGELVSEYKKQLRDGEAHTLHKERVAEELGDILWYIADVADLYSLGLEAIAAKNLAKCEDRWGNKRHQEGKHFDSDFPEDEQFPRRFKVTIFTVEESGKIRARMTMDGKPLGDDLTDNASTEDGYRFHDLFHLACAAMLGWSPVTRKLLGHKRKSSPYTDEIEDGGRATAIEEGVSALVFAYAREHEFLAGVSSVDYDLLRTIRGMTGHLEVAACTARDWQNVILQTYDIWRTVKAQGEGTVVLDLYRREIQLKS